MPDINRAHALLFTAPGCPHCPGVKAALEKLLAERLLSGLEVIDVSQDPARADELGIRSVPWLRLGEFILTGAQTPQQLRDWAERASGEQDMESYLQHLLANGELNQAEALLERSPQHIEGLLPLLGKADTPVQVRIGISAILEGLEGSETLQHLLPALIAMSEDPDHRLRSDACHFLGLSHSPEAEPVLRLRLEDINAEVREIAAEALETLHEAE